MRYLVTGDAQITIAASYRVSQTTVGRIIRETSQVIWDTLVAKEFLKAPETESDWLRIAEVFEKKWNFPHCVGAIDGKHVVMQAPANSGSMFFNYKKTFSLVLLAVCDGNYQFTLVDIGESGRQSDGGVFANSNIGFCIANDLFKLPSAKALPRSDKVFPYVFVGDDAFPLRYNLMKPYSNGNLDMQQTIANYRFCRARRIIENSFGILAARFRIFRRPIIANVEVVESVTKACVALHNYLMKDRIFDGDNLYCPREFIDRERRDNTIRGQWRDVIEHDTGLRSIGRNCSNNYSRNAKCVRDLFRDYVNSDAGKVSWQVDMVSVNQHID